MKRTTSPEANDRESRILIVEDDATQAAFLQELLSMTEEGYRVDVANTMADGLALCRAKSFDLLILDLNLPDSQGLVTMERFMEHDPGLSILLNTGMDDEHLAMQAMQIGAQDYLVKGQTTARGLVRAIRYALERKRTLDDLRASHAQLLQQEKLASIGQLAAGVAHEINNPMGFITSNLTTLGKYLANLKEFVNGVSSLVEKQGGAELAAAVAQRKKAMKIDFLLTDIEDLIGESLDGAERVKEIVKNLKSFSRVDDRERVWADLRECLDSTLNIVWNELKYKAEVVKEYDRIDPVLCYPQQLNQVFMNLLVNAGHAIDKQGVITIRIRQDDANAYVSVADTGCGIAPEDIGRVFEPFFTTKEVGKGTGLGLSIAYDIVTKKHGGELLVESEPGKGATFTVVLPRDGKT